MTGLDSGPSWPSAPRRLKHDRSQHGMTSGLAVRAYVAEGSRLPGGGHLDRSLVIPGNDTSPSPVGSYASVLLISELPDGFTWSNLESGMRADDSGTTIKAKVFESIQLSYSVQWFRKGARDLARSFRLWSQSQMGIQGAAFHGFTFYRTSEVRQLDEIVSEKWEERAGLDLYIGIVATLTQDVGLTTSIDIEISHDSIPDTIPPPDDAPIMASADGVTPPVRLQEKT